MEKASNKATDHIIEKRFLSEISAAELICRIIRSHIRDDDKKGAES